MDNKLKITINGKECLADKGEFLMDVADRNGIYIPRLCRHTALKGLATCRLCLVQVTENGRKRTVTSCIFPLQSDITVETDTREIRRMRAMLVALLEAEANLGAEELAKLKSDCGINEDAAGRFAHDKENACVMCGLCVKACEEMGKNCLATVMRGTAKMISTAYDEAPKDCIGCGACAGVCPTNCIAVDQESGVRKIWKKEFELLSCAVCGELLYTKEQYAHMSAIHAMPAEPVCDECAKKGLAARIKSAGKFSRSQNTF